MSRDDRETLRHSDHLSQPWIGWHFLAEDRRLRGPDSTIVKVGETYTVTGPLRVCYHGLHACRKALDALTYAPGPVVCRVQLSGEIREKGDKACARHRTVLAMADAEDMVEEFLCRCAEVELLWWGRNIPSPERIELGVIDGIGMTELWSAIEARRAWLRGELDDDMWYGFWEDVWMVVRPQLYLAPVETRGERNALLESMLKELLEPQTANAAGRSHRP